MTSAKIGTSLPVEKVTDNMASVRLPCPTPSRPLTLCSVNNIANLAWLCSSWSTVPAHPLDHGPLLFCLSISVRFEDSWLLLPRENKHVCSPHSSSSLLPASPVAHYLPWVQ